MIDVQELEANRDWCVEWLPTLAQSFNTQLFIKEEGDDEIEEDEKNEKKVWFILPDTKEVELCKEDWKGQRYRNSALFTSIEAVTEYYFTSSSTTSNTSNNSNKDNKDNDGYSKPWGSTIANFANQLVKGNKDKDDSNNKDGNKDDSPQSLIPSSGLLGDENSLDTLTSKEAAALHLVCQPGNGGKLPVNSSSSSSSSIHTMYTENKHAITTNFFLFFFLYPHHRCRHHHCCRCHHCRHCHGRLVSNISLHRSFDAYFSLLLSLSLSLPIPCVLDTVPYRSCGRLD